VGGAVWLGGHLMRNLPHDQVFVFPVGSAFPNAARLSASWRRVEDTEPSGGVTLTFDKAPPLQIRSHASLPNGDYVVSLNILENPRNGDSIAGSEGVQTNIERRVTLTGGEALVALAAGGF
ncbi:MAG TPA: hypothetical protein VF294_11505, partial [Polyangiaceae bacterium]